MSRKRKRKMNAEIINTPTEAPAREIIGTNPDGSPIYLEEEFTQTPAHTGEATPQ